MFDFDHHPDKRNYTERVSGDYMRAFRIGTAPDIDINNVAPHHVWFSGSVTLPVNMSYVTQSVFDDAIFIGEANEDGSSSYSFTGCIFLGLVSIIVPPNRSVKKIIFQDCLFRASLSIKAGKDVEFEFIRSQVVGDMDIISGSFNDFSMTGEGAQLSLINSIKINFSKVAGKLFFSKISIDDLGITGFIGDKTELIVDTVRLKAFEAKDLSNYGKLKLVNINSHESTTYLDHFHIINSNMGKAEFFNVDFVRCTDVILLRNLFSDTIWVSVRWPERFVKPKNEDREWAEIRDTYRQLKYIYAKQGDAITEHIFHRREMLMYRNYVWQNLWHPRIVRSGPRVLRYWRTFAGWTWSLQNLLILVLSWIGSNFGISWIRPIVFLITANSILLAIGASKGIFPDLDFSWNNISNLKGIIHTLPHVVYYSNPLRKFDEQTFRGWPIFLDIGFRVVSSYCLYNIIRATRRFVR